MSPPFVPFYEAANRRSDPHHATPTACARCFRPNLRITQNSRKTLQSMIRAGFLDADTRKELTALVRDGKAQSRVKRRANALLLLDDGLSCEAIARVLYMDDGHHSLLA